jgi:hypothetical protein
MSAFVRTGVLALALGAIALTAASCGVGNPTTGITSRVGQAQSARAVSSLQQALITAKVAGSDGAGSAGAALAAELQARDPNNTYAAALPTAPGQVQVVGGGGGPVLLVTYSEGDGGQPGYVAAWQDGTTTRWFLGPQAPAYSSSEPIAAGWSQNAPTATSATSATPVSSGAQ